MPAPPVTTVPLVLPIPVIVSSSAPAFTVYFSVLASVIVSLPAPVSTVEPFAVAFRVISLSFVALPLIVAFSVT